MVPARDLNLVFRSWLAPMAGILWLLLLIALFAHPFWIAADERTTAELLTRNTVRLSLLYYVVALTLMTFLRLEEWRAENPRGLLTRWCWTLAWAAFAIHVGVAMQLYHHGSHAEAIQHTQDASGFGAGIYVSHLFTLLWTLDVAAWWLRPRWYAQRSPWVDRVLHTFLLFLWFCGTIVYETGLIRAVGVAVFLWLAGLWGWKRWSAGIQRAVREPARGDIERGAS
jgi:hypothetical protein